MAYNRYAEPTDIPCPILVEEADMHPRPGEGVLVSGSVYKAGAKIDYTMHAGADTIIAPGYSGIKPAYRGLRDAHGNAASFRHPRTEKGLLGVHPDRLLHPGKLGKQAVVAMIDLLCSINPGIRVILIGHSYGGVNAVDAALRRPDNVEAVVLLGSGGLEEDQNMGRLAKRMPDIVAQEGTTLKNMPKEDVESMFGQAAFHIMRNPWRTLGEGLEISNRDLMVEEINQLRVYGIAVHAVQLERDSFFPTNIAERDTRGLVDSFSVIEGLDHVGPQASPELVAEHIADMLANNRPRFELAEDRLAG